MAAARSSASSAGDKSTLRMVLFFACILACIGCMYLLIDFQTGLKPKLSGELILGQVDTVSYQHQDAPLRNFLFEYFGLLSYLLAAMIVYVGYFVCLKPTDIWHIDFYKTSLRILGFNFLFLGGAALLSRYSDLINTGAGGLLGDMLNMFCDLFLPHVVSVFIFAFLAFSGLTFLLGSSPNRVFERVGAGFFKVVPSKSEQNKAKAAKAAKADKAIQAAKSQPDAPDADASAAIAATAAAAAATAAAAAPASATEQEQSLAPSESMGAIGAMEAPNAAAQVSSDAEPMANNGPVTDFFAQAQQGMVGSLAPDPAFVGATTTATPDNREPRAAYDAEQAYAADDGYAADNSAANIAAEDFSANGPALGGGDPSILQPIDPRNPVSLPAAHQEYYEDQGEPYHKRDLEHEAVLDGLNAAEQQPYEPYAPYPEDTTNGMSPEMASLEQYEQAAPAEQEAEGAYDHALQEQQAQMAADPSLAPFANNQLYASQAVAEPMKGNELEQVPSPDVAPMPAMPHLQSAQAPQAPEPYSPYAAYQAQQAHAQAQQALQQYGDLSQSGDNSVGVSEHSMQGEMDAPLAPVQGATLDDIPSAALHPATAAAVAASAAGAVDVDESASEASTFKQYTEVTQESRDEAEISPYGYGTYAEQFVGRKLYPFNDGTQEQATSSTTSSATDAATTALESDNTDTQGGAAESVAAADTETPAAEPKDDGEVHTIVQRVDPEVFAAQLAAQKKAREEAAKAELERLEKEKAAKAEEEAKAKAEAEAKEKAEAEAEAATATAQESAGSELAEQDQVEAIDDDESDEEEEPIYAGTYASHLKQQKAATEKTEAKQDPDDAESSNEDEAEDEDDEDEDDEDDGPKYITPGAPAKPKKVKKNKKKQVAETAEDEAESEESEGEAAPRTIIQDTRKEFEAAQERAKAEAEAKAKAEEEARLAAEAKAKAEEEARLAAEAEAKAKAEEEARLAAEAEAKAKAEEEARLAAEAEAKAKAEEEARLAAEAEAKAKAEEEARLAAEAEAKAKAEEEARLAAEAKAKAEAEAAAQRESKESAIIAALSSLATELKNVTDSSLTSRHAHDESLDAGLTTAAATTAAAATAATAAAATDATAATAGVALNNAAADASLAAESVITSVQVSDLPVRDDPAIEQELESDALQQDSDSFTSNTHIQKGSGAPDAHLSRPELNPHTTITRGPSVDSDADDDFLKYAVARNNAQQAGEVQDGPVTVNLFSDYLEESKKREQSLYQPQHSYDFGQGQQVGTVDESLAGQVGSDSDGVDDFVTGATHLAQAPVRTQKFNFAQLAQAKAEAEAAAHEVSAQPVAPAPAAADAVSAEQVTAGDSAQSESEKDDNIIAFNNFGAHEPQTYEVGDLTPAFIPMPNEEANPAGGHLSSGELSSIYEQDNAEGQAQAPAPVAEPEVEPETNNDSEQTTAVQAEPEVSAESYDAEEYDDSDESDDTDDAEELDDGDDANDYEESDDADDDEYYEEDSDESDSEDESEPVAQVQGAEAAFNQGGMQVNNGSLMNPMMGMANRGMQSPQTMYQTMPNGQQVQYVQMPNGQYMPVMQNGMMYQNMSPNMGMAPAMNPMGNMPMQNMPQYVQLPNGQYVQMMPNAQNMMYSQMQQLQQMQQMQQLQTNQGMTMPAQGMPAQGMMPNMSAAALQGQAGQAVPVGQAGQTVPAGQTAAVEDSESMGAGAAPVEPVPIEDVPDLEDRFTDGLPDSAAAMARELLDEDESDSVVGTHGMGAHEMGAHGASGVGFPTAGNAFMGAHNSSSSNLPSYMAGVQQAAPVRFDTPQSLSLCSVPRHNYDSWRPELSLLARSNDHVEMTIDDLNKTSERINSVLHSFGVKASVADYITGPVITRFDLDLKPGVKSSAISSIDKELCRNLLVSNVRVVPFIDGSSYVGLEVPNPKRKFITLGDMVTSREFQETKASLPMCLGASVVGTPVVKDLAETPHLLVAGTTGSGKSAGLNTMLISLLLKRSPAELRLILVDPKQLEFSIYKDLPHLITPVITDVAEKTPIALHWCVEEMERRFKLMSLLGVRKLSEYNELIRSKQAQGQSVPDPLWTAEMGPVPQSLKPLPWIVVVVEEFADLMAQSGRKKDKENTPESLIARLSAKSRAAGIHLVLVTQTPRSEVVTGMIKANFPSRIAFTVQSRLDSTIVLDDKGAETLLGNGDMLYKFTGASSPTRAHGAFTSNDDVKAVVDAWRQKAGAPEYLEDVIAVPEEEKEPKDEEKTKELDVKFDQAVELVRSYMDSHNKLPTITDLQTELGVGYPRAKKIFKQLTSEGIID